MLALAPRISHGSLTITLPDGRSVAVCGSAPGPAATLQINDHRLPRALLLGGNLAVGGAYIDGAFDSDDLAAQTEFAGPHGDPNEPLMSRPWPRPAARNGLALGAHHPHG